MNNETCTDNRFEVIKYFKEKLIQSTNIETSPDEMAVLDNILFRFWQMGWLDKLLLFKPEGMGKDYKGNTGKCNTGRCNTGNYNSGNWNTGNYNSGNRNTGNYNTGYSNNGYRNSGNWNTGNYNSGNNNTGDWNKTSFSNGCFNTKEPKIYLFNKPSEWTIRDWFCSEAHHLLECVQNNVKWVPEAGMTDTEKKKHPEAEVTGGYLKKLDNSERNIAWWRRLAEYEKRTIKAIPNFDKEIFKEITGIDVDCNYNEIGEE